MRGRDLRGRYQVRGREIEELAERHHAERAGRAAHFSSGGLVIHSPGRG